MARIWIPLIVAVLTLKMAVANFEGARGPDNFLEKFGYLPKVANDKGMLHSPEAREEAIKDFQRMVHIPDTGVLDDETRKWMIAPRCGVPDHFPDRANSDDAGGPGPQNFEVPGLKWKKKHLTYRIHNWTPDLDQGTQRRAIWRAFKYWADVSSMTFSEVSAGEADINIKYGRYDHGDPGNNPFDGPGSILAHAYFPESGMLHFDEDEDWTANEDRGSNLRIVAAHEIGHALGLQHSTVWESLMAPFYAGYESEATFKLHQDDIDGVQYLYGANTGGGGGDRPGPRPEPTTTTTTTTTQAPQPSYCDIKFDAGFTGPDQKSYVISGSQIYQLDDRGVARDFPQSLRSVFPRGPYSVDGAVYSPRTGRTYLFKSVQNSRRIWRYSTRDNGGRLQFTLDRYFPLDRSQDRYFPRYSEAAFTDRSGNIYLLNGDNVFKMSEYYLTTTKVGSRRSLYPNIPNRVDSAVRYGDNIHFFSDSRFWKFREGHGVISGPNEKAATWLGCRGYRYPK